MALAGILVLTKIIAQMVTDHRSAHALFERLGFRVEAPLPDSIEDREGRCRDLLLMAYDLRNRGQQAASSATSRGWNR